MGMEMEMEVVGGRRNRARYGRRDNGIRTSGIPMYDMIKTTNAQWHGRERD